MYKNLPSGNGGVATDLTGLRNLASHMQNRGGEVKKEFTFAFISISVSNLQRNSITNLNECFSLQKSRGHFLVTFEAAKASSLGGIACLSYQLLAVKSELEY